ncbi:hypothetical protein NLJ89_g7097 [Agrocybe chaxingu]|uniref:RNA helicase n=1 Tax=Agrocybe chaxingu TaxID=84603 RepID=A0A9W8JX10_9AGAR|nr:hypothetical protein NLJ89_g7097 [Agrocybe chaxingu]
MAPVSKLEKFTVDDLLRHQEEPMRKKRRLSKPEEERCSDSDSGPDSGGSDRDTDKPVTGDHIDRDDYDEVEEEEDEDEFSSSIKDGSLDVEDRFAFKSRASQPSKPNTTQSSELLSSFTPLGICTPLQAALKSMSIKKLSVDPYGIFALVLTPTRELAFQISEQFAVLGAALNIKTAVVVGGMDMMSQALELGNRPHVVIATPGRIVDHLRSTSGEWDLSRVKFLVLDEADRLLTPTFSEELAYLFNALPRDRQTCLFTATLTPSIETLAGAPPRPGKQKPFVHRMKEAVETVSTLKQHFILVPSHVREPYLYHLLCNPPESTVHLRRAPPEPVKAGNKSKSKSKSKKPKTDHGEDEPEQPPPTIIFCAKPRTAAYLTALLKTLSIRSTALHSRLTQRERLSSLSLFRAYVVPVLISTDVGARGLDIADVAMVINWDLPNEPEEYTHRVGRTARAGKGGVAVSFVTETDEERVLKIEDRIKTKLEEMTLPENKVLEQLNAVSTAKRLANMELHDSNFGRREEIHKIKNAHRSRPEKVAGV